MRLESMPGALPLSYSAIGLLCKVRVHVYVYICCCALMMYMYYMYKYVASHRGRGYCPCVSGIPPGEQLVGGS